MFDNFAKLLYIIYVQPLFDKLLLLLLIILLLILLILMFMSMLFLFLLSFSNFHLSIEIVNIAAMKYNIFSLIYTAEKIS